MRIYKTIEGFNMPVLSDKERANLWAELAVSVDPVVTGHACYTPHDNLEYFWISDTQTAFEKYTAVLRVNGKQITVKYTLCNQHEKINSVVRKAYNK